MKLAAELFEEAETEVDCDDFKSAKIPRMLCSVKRTSWVWTDIDIDIDIDIDRAAAAVPAHPVAEIEVVPIAAAVENMSIVVLFSSDRYLLILSITSMTGIPPLSVSSCDMSSTTDMMLHHLSASVYENFQEQGWRSLGVKTLLLSHAASRNLTLLFALLFSITVTLLNSSDASGTSEQSKSL